jgi:hypothetical protein
MQPPPKKKRWVILSFSIWCGNSLTHPKIVNVRATVVRFWFQNYVQICETKQNEVESLKSNKNCSNRSQSLFTYFENEASRSALLRIWFWRENWNCETILVKMVCKLLISTKNKGIALFFVYSFECKALSTQKQRYLFIVWPVLTICTPF